MAVFGSVLNVIVPQFWAWMGTDEKEIVNAGWETE